MIYIIFIIFGLAPSIIWLLFYLKKDAHPESKKMVLKIFFYGMLGAVIAAIIEIELSAGLVFLFGRQIEVFPIIFFIFYQFIVIALVEESSKFLIVKEKVVNDPEFDEPVDAMVYMIIAALGFAALENILVLFTGSTFQEAVMISALRFLGATFLHALASGVVGYFLALSFFESKKRLGLIIKGLSIAAFLHGLFNISIIIIEKGVTTQNLVLFISSFIFLIILLASLALFVSYGFRKLKILKSICEIK